MVLTFYSNVFHIIIPLLYQERGTLDAGKTNIVYNLSLTLSFFFLPFVCGERVGLLAASGS